MFNIPAVVREEISRSGLEVSEDGVLDWTDDSSLHPRQWSRQRKLFDTSVILSLEFFTTLISNTGSIAARDVERNLDISHLLAIFSFTSMYLIGQAFGSIILPPYTECFGRKRSYIVSATLYAIFNILIAASGNLPGIMIGRFVSGFLSGIPTVATAGSIEDLWSPRARIWSVEAWVAAGLLGLSLSPVVATTISMSGWKWIYYIAAIGTAAIALLLTCIRESRPNQILVEFARKLEKKHKFTGLSIEHHDHVPSFKAFVQTMLGRPIHLFFTEPIVLLVTIMSATAYATIYLLTEALDVVYEGFGFTTLQSAVVFIAIGIGLIPTVLPRLYDARIGTRRKLQRRALIPEDKLFGFFIAAPVLALALWWFSWTIPPRAEHLSPFISIAALIPVGFATNEFDHVLTGYLTDTYSSIAASANAPLAFFRAVLCATYPLFAARMFRGLGNNVAGSVLAALATAYCGVAIAFGVYGRRIREASPWAQQHPDLTESKEQDKRGGDE